MKCYHKNIDINVNYFSGPKFYSYPPVKKITCFWKKLKMIFANLYIICDYSCFGIVLVNFILK